jgi:hypothetical protein
LPTRFKRRVIKPAPGKIAERAATPPRAAKRRAGNRGAQPETPSGTTGFAPPPRWAEDALFDPN